MAKNKKPAILQGSLDLLVLQSLRQGKMHGYSISRHVKSVSNDFLQIEEGSLYPALHRMQRQKLLSHEWRQADGRRRKYYKLTAAGKKALAKKKAQWAEFTRGIDGVLGVTYGIA